jgi:ATP-dependent DNA ligase
VVANYEQAMSHFQTLINQGHEGTILKGLKGTWKDGKPVWQIKLKLEIELELKITGFNYGTGKNSKVISSVDAESEDGLLKTSPTGIKEKEMQWITDNQATLLGKIITAKCSGVSQDHLGNYSLLHPVYKHVRDDKSTADTLANILDIEAMAKGLK